MMKRPRYNYGMEPEAHVIARNIGEPEIKCKSCGIEKPGSAFKTLPGAKKPQGSCASCVRERQNAACKRYYQTHKAKVNAQKKEYLQRNKDRFNAFKRARYYKNLETVRRQGREAVARFKARWPERYKIQHREGNARYRAKHPELWVPLSLDAVGGHNKSVADFIAVNEAGYQTILDGASVAYLLNWIQTEFSPEYTAVLFAYCQADFCIEQTAEALNKPAPFVAEVIGAVQSKAALIRNDVLNL